MNITFVSADDTIRMTFGIDPRSAVTDLTKIEKELGKDLTDVIQKAIDVAFNVTSQTFTRGPKNAYIVSYSWTLYPIYEGRVVEDNAVKSISVTIGDSDHNLYEFEGVGDHDVDAMITWLRKEHQVYYTPNDELLNEKKKWAEKVAKQQKKIDSYESTLSKITDIMEPKYAGPAWSETWDDLVERIKRLKTEHDDVRGLSLKIEELEEQLREANEELAVARRRYNRANNDRSYLGKRLLDIRKAAGMADDDPTDLVKYVEALREANEELANHRVAEGWLRKDNSDLAIDVANLKEQLRVLRYDILKVYREIFDCSNGDPEGSDEETLQDILTEYKRTLELKNVAEEKTIKYKELARENEENLAREREWTKKMGIVESVDYQNAKAARAELAYLYKTVLGKEKLDRDLSPHEVMKAILDEYKQREEFIRELSCSLGFGNPVVKPDNIDQKEKDILERVEKLKDDVWPCENSVTFAEHLRKEFPKFCKKYNVTPLIHGGSIHDWITYIFSVLADYRTLFKENNDELKDFRADICEVLGIDADELFGSPRQNDKYILEQVEKLKKTPNRDTFRDAICNALGMPTTSINGNIIGRIRLRQDCHNKLCKDYTELRKAIWEAMDRKPETLPEENARLVGEVRMLQLNDISLKWMHDEVAKAIGMDYPVTNNDIVNRVKSLYDANGSSCDVISDLNRQVTELKSGEKLLIEFRDSVAKAIGMDYPTTNQVILNNVQYIYKDREDAYKIVDKINDKVTALSKAKEDLQKDYDELGEAYSSVLKWNNSYAEVRRLLGVSADADADEMVDTLDQLVCERERCKRRYENWYSRYESEHRRANGEHKRAEKLRKDVTALTNHIEFLKLSNASQANSIVASQAFKNECRKLKEEKAKVIAALGQEIWDDCLK